MSKVNLTISERIATLAILNNFKGNLETMASIIDDIKQLPVEDKEWTKAERVETKLPEGASQWNWNDEKGGEKEIELQSPTLKYLNDAIKEKDEKGEITFNDKALISLKKKLNS